MLSKLVKYDDVYKILHDGIGFDPDPSNYSYYRNEVIKLAIASLKQLPTVERIESDELRLKPCPFCGEKNLF